MSTLSIAHYYRRNLPHIVARESALFITFSTYQRWCLPPPARTITLTQAVYSHGTYAFIHVVVVMPDHVHLVMTLPHQLSEDAHSLASVMKGIKGASARKINLLLGRRQHVWLTESYDHVVRRSEGLEKVCQYVLENPVRAGLVAEVDDYPWLWRSWVEGRGQM